MRAAAVACSVAAVACSVAADLTDLTKPDLNKLGEGRDLHALLQLLHALDLTKPDLNKLGKGRDLHALLQLLHALLQLI